MAEEIYEEVPEIDEILEDLIVQTIDSARAKLEEEGQFNPFTCILIDGQVYEQPLSGAPEEYFETAQNTVAGAGGARAYTFCYDGYLEGEVEGEEIDAVICEGGIPGEVEGCVLGMLYSMDEEGKPCDFQDELYYISECDNFLANAEMPEDEE